MRLIFRTSLSCALLMPAVTASAEKSLRPYDVDRLIYRRPWQNVLTVRRSRSKLCGALSSQKKYLHGSNTYCR